MRQIKPGCYRYFKGGVYEVWSVAKYTEEEERFVIYTRLATADGNLDNTGTVYARPYKMFASEVDHEKYPDVKQKYRFEFINIPPSSRFIDANVLIEKLEQLKDNYSFFGVQQSVIEEIEYVIDLVHEMPTYCSEKRIGCTE